MIHSTQRRTVIKTVSWRVLSLILVTSFAFVVTRKLTFTLAFLFFDMFIMTAAYYFHERIWQHIKYGRIREKLK